jgi:hypothetical protein
MNIEQQNDNMQNVPQVLDVRHLSQSQFAQLGMPYIAYLKPVLSEGVPAIAIHGADGTPMGLATDMAVAIAAVEQHEMRPVRVH